MLPSRKLSLSNLDPFTVGFESIFDRLDSIFEAKSNSFPHYDLIKVDEENYLIKLCLAGFKKEDIDIHLENGQLHIEGESKERNVGRYLHQGISARKFHRNFSIADSVEVLKAEMNDGILTLSLHNKIPESKKPKKIEIH